MLGDSVGDLQGKLTGRRVVSVEGGPKIEASFAEAGKLAGLDVNTIVTYASKLLPDGTLYGEGQGVIMAANGEGASFVGQGVGRFTETGGVSFRGALYSQSMGATLSKLNGTTLVYEHESDADDNTTTKLWEWK
jgi:hypothetical protein